MKKNRLVKASLLIVLLMGLIIFLLSPLTGLQSILFSPGKGMHDGKVDCSYCHTPFSASAGCNNLACHPTLAMSYRTAASFNFHTQVVKESCTVCHLEHAGPVDSYVSRKFRHELFPQSQNPKCETCHSPPKTAVHLKGMAKVSCNSCHTTQAWKPTHFDHQQLSSSGRNQCGVCHESPKDVRHGLFTDQCVACHQPSGWKPAYVEHNVLSVQGQISCGICHQAPQEEDHEDNRLDCGSCHSTENW